MPLESTIQKKITDFLEKQQWCMVINNIKTSKNWFPDLTVLLWESKCFFIEVKTEKWRLSKLQEFRIRELYERWYETMIPYWFDDFLEQFMNLKNKLWKQINN